MTGRKTGDTGESGGPAGGARDGARATQTRWYAAAAVAVTTSLGLVLTACASDDDKEASGPELSVSGAYMPQPAMPDMAAGFLTLRNTGGTADRLTSVTTPLSDDVTLHATKGTRMEQVSGMDIPADGELRLASGGSHLMLGKLAHKPKVGEKVRFTLHFADSGPIRIDVPVKPTTYRPKD